MNADLHACLRALPAPLRQQVDVVCDRFETAWQTADVASDRPRVEDYLASAAAAESPALTQQLVLVDIEQRRRAGENPQAGDYQARFAALDPTWLAGAVAAPALPATEPSPTPLKRVAQEPAPAASATGSPLRRLRCPHCHNPLQLTDDADGEVLCPGCGSSFRVREAQSTTTTAGMRQLGKFELLERVGLGGFGAVWKARDTQLDRVVALKIPHAGLLAEPDDLERFHREARAAARLRHPGIVTVHEVVMLEGLLALVSDFIGGVPLKELLQTRRLTFHETAGLIAEVAEALDYAHEMGLVHRDIKPANIMLDYRRSAAASACAGGAGLGIGRPLVMDFGLALRVDAEVTLTQEGHILGTPAYMSPEQAAGKGHKADRRSDVYSLGVVLYELLTGELPFRGSKAMLLLQVLREEPRPPRKVNNHIPRDLETICLKALAKEPGRRYATARELSDDLRRFLRGEPIQARPVGIWERGWRWARRRPVAAALLAVSGVAALALVGATFAFIDSQRLEATNAKLEKSFAETERARQDAEAQGQRAEAQGQRAEAALGVATFHQYFHYIERAQARWRAADLATVEPRLDDCPPERRNWEWQYLKRLCHADLLTLAGHTGAVRSVAFSPDWKWLASGSNDQTVKVWNATTGQVEHTLQGHTAPVRSVAFSPDGTRLASAGEDLPTRAGSVKIWNARTGRFIGDLEEAHGGWVSSVAFSPDGKQLASASFDRTVKVWDTTTGQLIRSSRHIGWDLAVAFSPDGTRLASGNADSTVHVWDARTGQELHLLKGHNSFVNSVAFRPDGARLASASSDGTVRLWDATTGQEIHTLKGHTSGVGSVAFRPDGTRLASASSDGTVKLWDATTGQEMFTYKGHTGGVSSVVFSPDGTRFASASNDGTVKLWNATVGVESVATTVGGDRTVKIWDARSGQELRTLTGHAWVDRVAVSPDGARLASASVEGTVKVWDATTGRETCTLAGHPGGVRSVAFSPDGARLASAGSDKTVKVWDATTGQLLRTLEGFTETVWSVAFSPDGTRLASGSTTQDEKKKPGSGEVKIWDATTWKEIRTLEDFTATVFSVAFSPDGTRLASGSATGDAKGQSGSGEVKIWDARTGQLLRTLTKHTSAVHSVAFSEDGTRIASAGSDKRVKVWDATTGQELLTFAAHTSFPARNSPLSKVVFSPDGRWLTMATGDDTVQVWDATTGQVAHKLHGHGGEVRSVVFSPDGRWIVSAGRDRTAKVWDTTTGQDARTLTGHNHWVDGLAFSPDGTQLASAGGDMTVRLWDLATGQEIRTLRGYTWNVYCVAFSPDGTQLASSTNPASGGTVVKIWDPRTGQVILDFKGHKTEVYSVVFSPDGTRIASREGQGLGTVKVWDPKTGQEQLTIQAGGSPANSVAFSPDGTQLAASSGNGTVKLWDATTGQEMITCKGHTSGVFYVAFSPDGTRLASAGMDGAVRVWDTTTGQEVLAALTGHKDDVTCVAFSPDGTRLASGSRDGTVKLWDATTGQEILTLGHTGRVMRVAFSPDGKWLASCSRDGTMKLWDARPWTPEGRVDQQALALVDGLFAKPLGRADVGAHLRNAPTLPAEVLSRALVLLERYREETKPEAYHQASWAVARQPYLNAFQYGFALRQAESACRLAPAQGKYLTTLGVAQYRVGQYKDALASLERAEQLNQDSPVDLAFLALTQCQLGQEEQARATLVRLRASLKKSEGSANAETHGFLQEAEALLQKR